MFKKTCFIVEGNEEDKNLLLSYIEKSQFLNIVGTAATYSDAVSFLLTHPVDVLFLDIELSDSNDGNGINIIESLTHDSAIIITSNDARFAVESYTLGKTADYLLKPIEFSRYMIAVKRALSNVIMPSAFSMLRDKSVFFKMGRKFQKFNLDEILYFEAYGAYLKVYTDVNKQPYVINESLAGVVDQLNKSVFIRVHKSFVINVRKIDSFDSNHIFIEGFPVPLGVSYKSKVDYLVKLLADPD